jgi:hypothetical protein
MNAIFCSSTTKYKSLYTLLLLFMTACFLTACEKSNQNNASLKSSVKKYEQATILEGLVTNDDGPVKAGKIEVTDNIKKSVASAAVQNDGQYSIEIPANTVLPIVLTFYPEAADGEKLITAVVHPTITRYDINPLSTSIAKKALEMGGYTHANMVRAAESAATVPDANKTTAGFRGDPTTQYGGWH